MSMLRKINNVWQENDVLIKVSNKWFSSTPWIKVNGKWKTIPAKTLYKKILKDNPTKSRRTDFSVAFAESTTGKLFIADGNQTQDGKTVYYYAGNTTNNWVYFAGKYWRIIRTNENGGIRLLYAGDGNDAADIGSSAFNSNRDHPSYVGWKYTKGGSLAADRGNANKSVIYNKVEKWFNDNIKSFYNYIDTNAIYCNDRDITSGSYSTTNNFNYAPHTRFSGKQAPKFTCNTSDQFKDGFGLMTADEVVAAGGVFGTNNTNAYYYLAKDGSSSITGKSWWYTMSPCVWSNSGATVFNVYGSGSYIGRLADAYVNNTNGVVRPVISLKPDALWKSGDGTFANPYKIVTNEELLFEKILEDNPRKSRRTDFSVAFTENTTGKIFIADGNQTQDGKTVYYYAGNTTNNWVYFAGKYWRIIRTNENGGIRLLYAGTGGEDGYIELSNYNTSYKHPAYVGWKYTYGNSLEINRENSTKSNAYNIVETWYNSLNNLDKKYIDLSAVYYNDRRIADGYTYNTKSFDYAGYNRTIPTLKHDITEDSFTGINSIPVGLMTLDELKFAGSHGIHTVLGPYCALNATGGSSTGSKEWWLMTPAYLSIHNNYSYMCTARDFSPHLGGNSSLWVYKVAAIRPVISLKPNVLWESGDGTFANPYKIKQS